jgi:hypothetical protein
MANWTEAEIEGPAKCEKHGNKKLGAQLLYPPIWFFDGCDCRFHAGEWK